MCSVGAVRAARALRPRGVLLAQRWASQRTGVWGGEECRLGDSIKELLHTPQPHLTEINQYYVEGGKMIRPAIVLQLAHSLQASCAHPQGTEAEGGLAQGVLASQRRLAEIVELIHAASLLHDDVVDEASTRRGRPSANARFSSKSAVLSGDYLLAQASVSLAELGNIQVITLLATVIKDLVEGELMQMNSSAEEDLCIEYYLRKSYLKTASLIAKSCQAVAVLGSHPPAVQQACYEFGRNLGLAFQIIDDKLDFTSSAQDLGKPAGADLGHGIITAPVLFATEEFPEICEIVGRRCSWEGDQARILEMVRRSRGVQRTQELAEDLLSRALLALTAVLSPPLCAPSAPLPLLIATVTSRSS